MNFLACLVVGVSRCIKESLQFRIINGPALFWAVGTQLYHKAVEHKEQQHKVPCFKKDQHLYNFSERIGFKARAVMSAW